MVSWLLCLWPLEGQNVTRKGVVKESCSPHSAQEAERKGLDPDTDPKAHPPGRTLFNQVTTFQFAHQVRNPPINQSTGQVRAFTIQSLSPKPHL